MSITHIRPATPADVSSILGLIKELAEFEKAPHLVTNTEEQLLKDGFGSNPVYQSLVAEVDKMVVAFALSYIRYSTWRGRVVYLEDIYVQPAFRSQRVGQRLMEAKLDYARSIGVSYISFQVLDWNTNAQRFYERFNAEFDPQWVNVLIPVAS